MKPVIRITIALGLMALSLAGCGSLIAEANTQFIKNLCAVFPS